MTTAHATQRDLPVSRAAISPAGAPPHGHGELAWAFFPHPVIITDAEDRVLSANPAARRLFGIETDASIWDGIIPVDGAVAEDIVAAVIGGLPWNGEFDVRSGKDGRCRVCATVLSIAETRGGEGGGAASRLWILEDVIDRRLQRVAEREREALRHRLGMAAGIAHDLNNCLAVVSGNAELLTMHLGDDLPESVTRCLSNMQQSLVQIGEFADSCLRLRRGGCDGETIDLNQFLHDGIAFLRPQSRFKRIIIESTWGEGVPPVACRPDAILQIFTNLVLNAADALGGARAEQCTVRVATRNASTQGDIRAEFLVADDGPGVAPEVASRLFREPVTTKADADGCGLMTVACLVDSLGGTVAVQRPEGGGAEFCVSLPGVALPDDHGGESPSGNESADPVG